MTENLLQLQLGSKSFGSRLIFNGASFAVNEGEHVGVIGPNGAGKTTLFKILVGEEQLDSGKLVRSKSLRIGYLSQHDSWKEGETIEDFISRDAHLPLWELKSLGRGLGLGEKHYEAPVQSLSGGYRMRAKLLQLLGQEPDLMLLDEPTNYLDLETLLVLEKFLQGYSRSFLLISHDREFLRRTTDHILEVEAGEVTKYNGTIDDYFEQKEMLRTQLAARAYSLEEKRAQILDFVARFGAKATKASQAQSRLKSLDKMESIELKPLPVSAKIRIPPPARVGKIVLKLDGVDMGYPERKILSDVHLLLSGGDHLAVVGLNGAGKSTLLKTLALELPALQGQVQTGYEATYAFFNQHVAEKLFPDDTVYRSLERAAHTAIRPQEILDLAGSLLFSGDDVKKPVRVLSGGEKSRVALGQVLLKKASCLILDEPTNHLDFATVEALTQALKSFEGSLVVVSHDRGFIGRIGTKILEICDGKAALYPGSYDDYVWSLENGAFKTLKKQEPLRQVESKNAQGAAESSGGASYTAKKKLESRLRQLEKLVSQHETKIAALARQLSSVNDELAAATDQSPAKIAELVKIQAEIEQSEAEWLSATDEKERLLLDPLLRTK